MLKSLILAMVSICASTLAFAGDPLSRAERDVQVDVTHIAGENGLGLGFYGGDVHSAGAHATLAVGQESAKLALGAAGRDRNQQTGPAFSLNFQSEGRLYRTGVDLGVCTYLETATLDLCALAIIVGSGGLRHEDSLDGKNVFLTGAKLSTKYDLSRKIDVTLLNELRRLRLVNGQNGSMQHHSLTLKLRGSGDVYMKAEVSQTRAKYKAENPQGLFEDQKITDNRVMMSVGTAF